MNEWMEEDRRDNTTKPGKFYTAFGVRQALPAYHLDATLTATLDGTITPILQMGKAEGKWLA